MDIVYIYGKGKSAAGDGFELRHSLRSIERCTGIGRVAVCGYCPDWLSDEVVKIPYFDGMPISRNSGIGSKSLNMMGNIIHAAEVLGTDEFLVSMDDHFYLKPVDFDNYPWYVRDMVDRPWRTSLPTRDQVGGVVYRAVLANTRELLAFEGWPLDNFDIHRNMHIRRSAIEVARPLTNKIARGELPAVCAITLWANLSMVIDGDIKPVPAWDFKIRTLGEFEARAKTEASFSTVDFMPGSTLYQLVASLYPNKSKYEL